MSIKPGKQRRGTPSSSLLLTLGKFAGVPALIVGLLSLGNLLKKGGFTPERLATVVVCALVILAALLIEKNEGRILNRLKSAGGGPADAEKDSAPAPVPEPPARPVQASATPAEAAKPVPVQAPPKPVEPARPSGRWQIGWTSGALDDIGLVYEKAEENEGVAQALSQLESLALDEARRHCDLVSKPGISMTGEDFDQLPPAEKETAVALLGQIGIQARKTDVANRELVVTLSPRYQGIMGCTVFQLLNWLEKLDGALDVMVDGKVTLTLRVPLGGKKGLMQWQMLILRLYPWLRVQETSANFVAAPLPERPAEAPAPPEGPAPDGDADPAHGDGAQALRDRIIEQITRNPGTKYQLASLLWDDAARCFPGGIHWDGAWFHLDLRTGELSAELGTYPNQFGHSQGQTLPLSAAEFHRIATQFGFSRELRQFKTKSDWTQLFNGALKAAVSRAAAAEQKTKEAQQQKQRDRRAIRILSDLAGASPKLHIQRVSLALNQLYGSTSLTLTLEKGVYVLLYRVTADNHAGNHGNRRTVSAVEAAWIEQRVERAVQDPDSSTWQSLPGGDTMNVEIRIAGASDVSLSNAKPLRKYTDLLNDLGNLAMYGSVREEDGKA